MTSSSAAWPPTRACSGEVNEGIERGQWPGEDADPVRFRCECARLGCNLLLEVTLSAYEQVRSHPRRFVMIDGHQVPELETVVQREPGYVVVQKLDQAGEKAEKTNPRS
jgi:hypothetical protein